MICWFFIALLYSTKVLADVGCPEDYDIFPCTCQQHTTGVLPDIVCRHRDIESIYRGLGFISAKTTQISSIKVQSSQTVSLRSILFGVLKVKVVAFRTPSLKSIAGNIFQGQEFSLREVTFDHTSLSELPTYILKNLHVLKVYNVYYSKLITYIRSIDFRLLQYPETLEALNFVHNSISVIENGAFQMLINIKSVNLRSNAVLSVNADIFPANPTKLQEISLWDNNLTALPSHLLKKLQTGATLDFDSNAIENIKEDDIATIVRKRFQIDLSGNPLNCDCSFVPVALANERSGTGITEESTCNQPDALQDRSLTNLSMNDFQHCGK